MDSGLILRIHTTSVLLFLITYVVKTILLFTNKPALEKYSSITKVPEMIISFLFLGTGIWLYAIIGGFKTMHFIKLALVFLSIPLAVIGFKKQKKILALISLVFIIGAYGIAEMNKAKPFIAAKTEVSHFEGSRVAPGASIYHQHCVFCHGADGKKMYRDAFDLTTSKLNEDVIRQYILEGSKGKMPSYRGIITNDADIDALVAYVKNLQPGAIAQ